MKAYISHKRVKAAQIAGVFAGSDTVQTVDGEMHKVPGLFSRSTPTVGDYLVEYDDGYRSHSPKAAFEGGYRLVGAPLEVAHQDGAFSVGFSNKGEGGGFTVLGDITDQVPFIVKCATSVPPMAGADRMLQFFTYQHLPEHLQVHSKPFHDLAQTIVDTLPANAERTAALRKLLEAKDCAVRARLYKEPERAA